MRQIEAFCEWCGDRLEGKRRHARFCSPRCRRQSFSADPCYYCGLPAASRDHVIPQSMHDAVALRWPHLIHSFAVTVPACSECNGLAGAKLFPTLGAKRRWLKARLRVRYAKLLDAPNWSEEELQDLGYELRTHVRRAQVAKEITKQRLRWPTVKDT